MVHNVYREETKNRNKQVNVRQGLDLNHTNYLPNTLVTLFLTHHLSLHSVLRNVNGQIMLLKLAENRRPYLIQG